MGWLLDTDYDAATTPPGLRAQQLPLICEQVCRAINERRYAKGTALQEFYYVDSLTGASKKNYPTVADFEAGGCLIHGAAFKTIMQAGMNLVASPGVWYTDTTFANRYGVDATPTIAATVSATLPAAANASKGVLWAPNWMYITRGLNLMKYCETPAPITSDMTVDYDVNQMLASGFFATYGDTPEEAWANIEWAGEMTVNISIPAGFMIRGVGATTPSGYLAGGGIVCISPEIRDATNGGILTGCIRAVGVSVNYVAGGPPMPKVKLNGTDTGLTATPTSSYRQVIIASTSSDVEISVDYDEGPYEYPGLVQYGVVWPFGAVPDVDVFSDISSLLTDQS